jgi:hypothetical protein
LYFQIPLLSFVFDKIETLNIEKNVRRKNDCKADGYVANDSNESVQVETTAPQKPSIPILRKMKQEPGGQSVAPAEEEVATTDAVTENVNQALSSIGFQCRKRGHRPKTSSYSDARL